MAEIIARTASKDYSIVIRNGLLEQLGPLVAAQNSGKRVLVVTDEHVAPLYLGRVLRSLHAAGLKTASYEIETGETAKNMHTLNRVYTAFYMAGLTRADVVIALGGGVVGDLVGFAAATYQRGLKLIQAPTTLLAQVDSAIGGKTGVDMPFGKNMVGAFYQPHAVFIDPLTLQTLPREELHNGLAEAIKYGCIRDRVLFERLEQKTLDLEWVTQRCVQIKVDVVRGDELDSGERMILNFGHSVGHAIERITQYEVFRHGEAVGIGMIFAAGLGEYLGVTPPGTAERIRGVLKAYQLPIDCNIIEAEELVANMASDKKRIGDKLNFILLREIGAATLYPLTLEELEPLVKRLWP